MRTGYHPDGENEDGEKGNPKEVGYAKAHGFRIPKEIRKAGDLKASDVLDITLTNLGVRIRFVLVDGVRHRPAAQLPYNTHNAACPVLSMRQS